MRRKRVCRDCASESSEAALQFVCSVWANAGQKALAFLLTFPRPEGLGSLWCELGCRVSHPFAENAIERGTHFSCRLGLPEKQILRCPKEQRPLFGDPVKNVRGPVRSE